MALSRVPKQRRRRPPADEITPDTPIWCPACQCEHPASAFTKETRRYSGLATVCRAARATARQTEAGRAATKERNQARWADPQYRDKSREWQRLRRRRLGATHDLRRARLRLQAIVDAWKTPGCADCGYANPRGIDPDHRDGTLKVGHVSRLVQLCVSADRLRAELAKCCPRCARCHRRVTQEQRASSWRTTERIPPSWQRRLDMQDRNDAIKLSLGCADCGWAGWARGLDWDHVRGQKVATIAILIANGRPWTDVLAEMDKCELVCANCHRIRTAARRAANTSLKDGGVGLGPPDQRTGRSAGAPRSRHDPSANGQPQVVRSRSFSARS